MTDPSGYTDGSFLSFHLDPRYREISFDCFDDRRLAAKVVMPLIGWAVQVFDHPAGGKQYTRIVPVGLDDDGLPVTPEQLAGYRDLPTSQLVHFKVMTADGTEARAVVTTEAAPQHVPYNEVVGYPGAE